MCTPRAREKKNHTRRGTEPVAPPLRVPDLGPLVELARPLSCHENSNLHRRGSSRSLPPSFAPHHDHLEWCFLWSLCLCSSRSLSCSPPERWSIVCRTWRLHQTHARLLISIRRYIFWEKQKLWYIRIELSNKFVN